MPRHRDWPHRWLTARRGGLHRARAGTGFCEGGFVNGIRYRAFQFVHPDFDVVEGHPGLQSSPTGALATVEDEASVRQSILLLLSTAPGERVMRPDYGCDLRRLLFEPNDDTTAGLAIH